MSDNTLSTPVRQSLFLILGLSGFILLLAAQRHESPLAAIGLAINFVVGLGISLSICLTVLIACGLLFIMLYNMNENKQRQRQMLDRLPAQISAMEKMCKACAERISAEHVNTVRKMTKDLEVAAVRRNNELTALIADAQKFIMTNAETLHSNAQMLSTNESLLTQSMETLRSNARTLRENHNHLQNLREQVEAVADASSRSAASIQAMSSRLEQLEVFVSSFAVPTTKKSNKSVSKAVSKKTSSESATDSPEVRMVAAKLKTKLKPAARFKSASRALRTAAAKKTSLAAAEREAFEAVSASTATELKKHPTLVRAFIKELRKNIN